MARSAEALRRRAEKRNRTEEEQRRVDADETQKVVQKRKLVDDRDMNAKAATPIVSKQEPRTKVVTPASVSDDSKEEPQQKTVTLVTAHHSKKSQSSENTPAHPDSSQTGEGRSNEINNSNSSINPLDEPGAWKCPGCGNHNFASRHECRSTTCDEKRPLGVFVPPRRIQSNSSINPLDEPGAWKCPGCSNHNFASRHECRSTTCDEKRPLGVFVPPRRIQPKPTRHDPVTSKKESWGEQAGKDKILHNQELRQRYLEKGAEGMSEEDIVRAKLLIERDERKKTKKEAKKKYKATKKQKT
eukprot:scaffold80964_cov57-Attheya_sp.AAC.4